MNMQIDNAHIDICKLPSKVELIENGDEGRPCTSILILRNKRYLSEAFIRTRCCTLAPRDANFLFILQIIITTIF